MYIWSLKQQSYYIIVAVLVNYYSIINSLIYIMSHSMFWGEVGWNKCCFLYKASQCLTCFLPLGVLICAFVTTVWWVCKPLFSYRMYINHPSQTMRGILKRKFAEVDDNPCYSSSSPPSSLSSPASSEWESDGESSPSDNQDFAPHSPSSPADLPSKSPDPHPLGFFSPLSNNANLLFICLFSLLCCIGVTLISLQQRWYENANLRVVLDNAQQWLDSGLPV